MSNRKRCNHLTIQQRFRMLDWLRAHSNDLPNMTGEEIVKAVTEAINHRCSIEQIRSTAKAANMRWKIKHTPTGRQTRMDRLEARILELERWCLATANGLGIEPPLVSDTILPDDDEL